MGTPFRWLGIDPGESVAIRPFDGAIQSRETITPATRPYKIACAIDVETTGLDHARDTVIEIGMRSFAYDPATGEVLGIVDSYDALQDPGAPLPERIVELTGITDADVAGQSVDRQRVREMLRGACVVVAHNAAFDRGFVDALAHDFEPVRVPWACSLELIDWPAHGLPSSKLEALCMLHGFYGTSHRAGADAASLVRLLSLRNGESGATYLSEMLAAARVPTVIVAAVGSPFEAKDALRERSYRWDAAVKVWSRAIPAADIDEESEWLAHNAYRGAMRATFTKVNMMTRYSRGS